MKNLKRIMPILLIAIFSTTTLFAQHRSHQRSDRPERFYKPGSDKFKAMKVGYLTEKLDLSSAEAEKFWPVYNEYAAKKGAVRKLHRAEHKDKTEKAELSDADIEKKLNQRIEKKQKELDIEKAYLAKFKSLLPIKKVAKLYRAEESFKKDLLRRMRDTPPPPKAPKTPKEPKSSAPTSK